METQIWRVPLPDAIGEPLEVYVNGVLQRPGTDYELLGRDMIYRFGLFIDERTDQVLLLESHEVNSLSLY